MATAKLRSRSTFLVGVLLATSVGAVFSPVARAATFTESFTNGALSTSISIQQNGVDLIKAPASPIDGTEAQYNNVYAGSYGLVGYYLNLHQVTSDVTITFPSNARPTSFSFIASIVNGAQPASYTYADGTTTNFNIPDTVATYPPNYYTTFTVTGDGRAISNFKILGGVSRDYWALDNLTWSALVQTQSTITLSQPVSGVYRTNTSIIATINTPGKVTFLANGKRIPGCISILGSSSVTCNWKPSLHQTYSLSASLIPTDSSYVQSFSSSSSVKVVARSGNR